MCSLLCSQLRSVFVMLTCRDSSSERRFVQHGGDQERMECFCPFPAALLSQSRHFFDSQCEHDSSVVVACQGGRFVFCSRDGLITQLLTRNCVTFLRSCQIVSWPSPVLFLHGSLLRARCTATLMSNPRVPTGSRPSSIPVFRCTFVCAFNLELAAFTGRNQRFPFRR